MNGADDTRPGDPRRILEVEALSVRFHGDGAIVRAVNDVTFHVDEGEAVGIVGESGSGKSVTALSVMGLVRQPPAAVTFDAVRFRGQQLDLTSFSAMSQVRGREMAMVFQDPMTSLNPVLTIEIQIREVIEHHLGLSRRAARERTIDLLRMVGIPGAEHRLGDYPHQFSGGMRQRVMIAIALACEPKLLIADEPTTALDVTVQAEIVELIRRLRRDLGLAVVWITHDLGLLARLVDRVIVMYGGRIMEEGPVDVIYGSPRLPYTIGLLQSVPTPRTERGLPLRTIKGTPPDPKSDNPACPFRPRCDYAIEKCAENPPLEEYTPGHRVACWVRPDGAEALAEWRGHPVAAAGGQGSS